MFNLTFFKETIYNMFAIFTYSQPVIDNINPDNVKTHEYSIHEGPDILVSMFILYSIFFLPVAVYLIAKITNNIENKSDSKVFQKKELSKSRNKKRKLPERYKDEVYPKASIQYKRVTKIY